MTFKLFLFTMLIAVSTATAQLTKSGKVIRVHDGDTFTILENGVKTQVRLNCIDAPELSQDFGINARDTLSKMIQNKTVTVKSPKLDKYGRTVGTVYIGSLCINVEMVHKGSAMVYECLN